MPNYCYNDICVHGSKKNILKLKGFFTKENYEKFDTLNEWVEDFLPKKLWVQGKDCAKYGSRHFRFRIEQEDQENLRICGDSAWSPMETLSKLLAEFLDLDVAIEFEESGWDFAGITRYKGKIEVERYTTTCHQYAFEQRGVEYLEEEIESYQESIDDQNEFLESCRRLIQNTKGLELEDKQKLQNKILEIKAKLV